ncbi:MAG: biosynthetic-type acetolactate synthase large subunit [Clostridiales bacterium]|nr:biosynthetic-type acetolactate synthase large subunit [Clostridiales bacterium]
MEWSGARIIVEVLIEQNVDTAFGYPGGQVLPLYDELYKNSHRLRHVMTAHEQGAAHAADGYARATGRTGVAIATSGPGATNLVTGIACAYYDSSPMVAITGNVPLSMIGRDSFQEVDIMGVTMPITKHNYIVKDVRELAPILREAFAIARSGRPGPVLVDVPRDVQVAKCEFEPAEAARPRADRTPGEKALASAAALLNASRRPFIYAGGGVVLSGAAAQLNAFAEKLDAPVGASIMGLTAMPTDHPRFMGMTGMHGGYAANRAMQSADLIVAVGTRFSDRATGEKSKFAQDAKILHIDIDPAEIDKNIPSYHSVVGNLPDVFRALVQQIQPGNRLDWWRAIAEYRAAEPARENSGLHPRRVISLARAIAGPDALVTTDVGQHQMWTAQYCSFRAPRSFLTSGGLGAMGFGMGAAIGGCIGGANRRTILFTGDGSFHMNLNEMATAVSENLPLTVIVMNNSVLGMVRQWQTLFYDKRYASTTHGRRTDFAALARAFGARGYRADDPGQLEDALRAAIGGDGPAVVDVRIDCDEMVLPMIPPGGSIDNIILN